MAAKKRLLIKEASALKAPLCSPYAPMPAHGFRFTRIVWAAGSVVRQRPRTDATKSMDAASCSSSSEEGYSLLRSAGFRAAAAATTTGACAAMEPPPTAAAAAAATAAAAAATRAAPLPPASLCMGSADGALTRSAALLQTIAADEDEQARAALVVDDDDDHRTSGKAGAADEAASAASMRRSKSRPLRDAVTDFHGRALEKALSAADAVHSTLWHLWLSLFFALELLAVLATTAHDMVRLGAAGVCARISAVALRWASSHTAAVRHRPWFIAFLTHSVVFAAAFLLALAVMGASRGAAKYDHCAGAEPSLRGRGGAEVTTAAAVPASSPLVPTPAAAARHLIRASGGGALDAAEHRPWTDDEIRRRACLLEAPLVAANDTAQTPLVVPRAFRAVNISITIHDAAARACAMVEKAMSRLLGYHYSTSWQLGPAAVLGPLLKESRSLTTIWSYWSAWALQQATPLAHNKQAKCSSAADSCPLAFDPLAVRGW